MGVQPSGNGEKCLRRNFPISQGEINIGTVLRESFFSTDERWEDIIMVKCTELFGNTLHSA
jgi:hypothetical protein